MWMRPAQGCTAESRLLWAGTEVLLPLSSLSRFCSCRSPHVANAAGRPALSPRAADGPCPVVDDWAVGDGGGWWRGPGQITDVGVTVGGMSTWEKKGSSSATGKTPSSGAYPCWCLSLAAVGRHSERCKSKRVRRGSHDNPDVRADAEAEISEYGFRSHEAWFGRRPGSVTVVAERNSKRGGTRRGCAVSTAAATSRKKPLRANSLLGGHSAERHDRLLAGCS